MCKKYLFISLLLSGVFLVSCSSKKETNVEIVGNSISDNTQVTSEEPIATNEVILAEEPATKDTTVTEDTVVTKKPSQGNLSEKEEITDKENDGDIIYTEGDNYKFINPDDFLKSVPLDNIKKFNKSVPDDMLSVYPDLTFVAFDKSTGNIYAKSEEYYFKFDYLKDSYSYMYELKEYVDWWTYDE